MLRALVTPRWWGRHLLLTATLAALFVIGRWQWDKARGQGDWQNYGYAVQWWAFAAFAILLWGKFVLDELVPDRVENRTEDAVLPVVVQRQAPAPADEDDDELAAYNRHLQALHQRPGR